MQTPNARDGKRLSGPGAAGALLAFLGSSLARNKYLDSVQDSFTGEGLGDWGLRKLIQFQALGKGYLPATVDSPDKSHILKFKDPKGLGPFKAKGLLASSPDTSPGIMAHEYGHILQDPNTNLYAGSLSAPALGALGVLGLKSNKSKLLAALAGTAGSAPVLGYELDASRRGKNFLESAGYDNPGEAYSGVPTYGIHAGVPGAVYGLERLLTKTLTRGRA